MEEEKTEIGDPVIAGEMKLVPVTRFTCGGSSRGYGVSFQAKREPVAVVIIAPAETYAFRTTGERVSLDDLAREVPNIEKVISGAR